MPKLRVDLNIAAEMHAHAHGISSKKGVVLHETVSPNFPGLRDVKSVADYLGHGEAGYAVHAITDDDGNVALALGKGADIYWHCAGGNANQNFLGIEQVSNIMVKYSTRPQRIKAWLGMSKELNATAKLLACYARAWKFPLADNKGNTDLPGVTTHWEVTTFNKIAGGHTDAFPSTSGGYYPKHLVLKLAKRYYALGWHF